MNLSRTVFVEAKARQRRWSWLWVEGERWSTNYGKGEAALLAWNEAMIFQLGIFYLFWGVVLGILKSIFGGGVLKASDKEDV